MNNLPEIKPSENTHYFATKKVGKETWAVTERLTEEEFFASLHRRSK